jgi:enoyl-CoA hydratase/carnithine racemase
MSVAIDESLFQQAKMDSCGAAALSRRETDPGTEAMTARARAPAAATEPALLRENVGNIAVLTLNRPQTRNSLSEAMLAALSQELESIAVDKRVRAMVVAARGPTFSAGHDLKELTAHRADPDGGRSYTRQIMERCSAVMLAVLRLPQPVIAAVEATATAAGCQLVATCDLAVASTTAKFCTPGVHIGWFCSTPMVALSRNVGRKHAMEMLLTGDMISAEDAYRVGLVNRVVEPGAAREEALKLARKIAAKSAAVVKLGKEAFYRQLEMDVADAYQHAIEVMVQNMMARDAEEGMQLSSRSVSRPGTIDNDRSLLFALAAAEDGLRHLLRA